MSTMTEQSKMGANREQTENKVRETVNAGIESGQQAYDEAKSAVSAGAHAAQQKVGEAIDKAKETAANVVLTQWV